MSSRDETKRAIAAVISVADDLAAGRMTPEDLDKAAVDEVMQLAGTVIGPEDPVWPVQVSICRQVLAAGGVPGDELAEWAAVYAPPAERAPSWIEQALAELAEDEEPEESRG